MSLIPIVLKLVNNCVLIPFYFEQFISKLSQILKYIAVSIEKIIVYKKRKYISAITVSHYT